MSVQSFNIAVRDLASAGDHVVPEKTSRLGLVVINAGTDPASLIIKDSAGADQVFEVIPPNTRWSPPDGLRFVAAFTVNKTTNSLVKVVEYF